MAQRNAENLATVAKSRHDLNGSRTRISKMLSASFVVIGISACADPSSTSSDTSSSSAGDKFVAAQEAQAPVGDVAQVTQVSSSGETASVNSGDTMVAVMRRRGSQETQAPVATPVGDVAQVTQISSSGGTASVNSVDTVVADMRLRNDFVLRGYESFKYGWYVGPGDVQMGNNPSFSNSPTWSIFYNNPAYAGAVAKAMLPWVVVFDGANHAASNTAVEMRNMRAYIKSRATGRWSALGGPTGVSGMYYGKPNTGLPALSDVELSSTETSTVVKIHSNPGYFWHGWWEGGRVAINPNDIAAVFVTVQARTVVADPNKPDDRGSAQLGLQVGADYYLDTKMTFSEGYAPAVGIARTKNITGNWQAYSFTTFSDVGSQNPGGGITEAEFRAAPPPLD